MVKSICVHSFGSLVCPSLGHTHYFDGSFHWRTKRSIWHCPEWDVVRYSPIASNHHIFWASQEPDLNQIACNEMTLLFIFSPHFDSCFNRSSSFQMFYLDRFLKRLHEACIHFTLGKNWKKWNHYFLFIWTW